MKISRSDASILFKLLEHEYIQRNDLNYAKTSNLILRLGRYANSGEIMIKGVKFEEPEAILRKAIKEQVSIYLDDIQRKNKKGGLFLVATRTGDETLVNVVGAYRVGNDVEIGTWIGSRWGAEIDKAQYEAGIQAKWYFD